MNRILIGLLITIILLLGIICVFYYTSGGAETFKGSKSKSAHKAPAHKAPAHKAPAHVSKSKTKVVINMGHRSSYGRGSGIGYGYGYHPSTLPEAVAVGVVTAVIKNKTDLLCKDSTRLCSFDHDCCSKSCLRQNSVSLFRTTRRCL